MEDQLGRQPADLQRWIFARSGRTSSSPTRPERTTEIRNAAQARIDGAEIDLTWAASYNLTISGGFAWYDAKLTADYCAQSDANGIPVPDCYLPSRPYDRALAGSRLPVTAKFKGNLTGRYIWDIGEYEANVQASVFHQGDRVTDLREAQRELLGELEAYTLTDLSAGIRRGNWSLDFFLKNVFDERTELARFTQCATLVCGNSHTPSPASRVPSGCGFRRSSRRAPHHGNARQHRAGHLVDGDLPGLDFA